MLSCDWFKYTTIPQSFAAAKNQSSSSTNVRHIGWHLADAREYLLTSVASTVSRRIYIYIRGLYSIQLCYTQTAILLQSAKNVTAYFSSFGICANYCIPLYIYFNAQSCDIWRGNYRGGKNGRIKAPTKGCEHSWAVVISSRCIEVIPNITR